MNCEWAEGYLSAYLDSTLDPSLREEVSAHLATCERCRDILADYRRFDALLATAPRISPPDSLRERIFSSPEFAAIARAAQRTAQRDSTRRERRPVAHMTLEPRQRPPAPHLIMPQSGAPALVAPKVSSVTPPQIDQPATDTAREALTPTNRRGTPTSMAARPWVRAWLLVAAVVLLALGMTLLFRQGFGPFRGGGAPSTHGKVTSNLAGPDFSNTPLSAGSRLVFAHNGALWSAAEAGSNGAPGAIARLTPSNVNVVAWSVSPVVNGRGGGQIAYIDGNTGALHLVRSDRQADHVLGAVVSPQNGQTISSAFWGSAAGQAIRAGLSWSPDGAHLAYVSVQGITPTLHVLDLTSDPIPQRQHDHTLTFGFVTRFAWSNGSDQLAYAQVSTAQGTPGIWLYTVATGQARQLVAQANLLASGAISVTQLAVLPATPSQGTTVVTWATSTGAVINGVFALDISSGGVPAVQRLTPAATHFATADVSAKGVWLLSDGATLVSVSTTTTLTPVATFSAPILRITWSPTGALAAILTQNTLSLWSPSTGLLSVGGSVATTVPVWSADGQRLAYQTSALVIGAHIGGGKIVGQTALARLANSAQATVLLWAPDGQTLGIASPAGVTITTTTSTATVVDHHVANGNTLAWSIAG
ncbi:MAG TPA: zf-HC2 domain-containing protein [Ktedonobacterales bacterium]|nr:zf-HC2 domain-containing protein [Ktedonobacterales bacterium]